ncbi:hypothetical protein EMPS_03300 [Entomortierella parvispora]|uniref:GATA-type domain-containing protein n=1 Tax=Entomortierella parvispora TaxID=205924 RepID=A0A9P3H6C6_9FUNG|nr:hypothetical protein EMPS_03300 [Entomortierella parvispora]
MSALTTTMSSSERGLPNDNTTNNHPTQPPRDRPLQHPSQQQHSRHLHHHHLQDMEYYRMDNAQTQSAHPDEISSRNNRPALTLHSYRPEGEEDEEELEVIGTGHGNTVEHETQRRLPRVLPNLQYGPAPSSVQNFSPGTSLIFNAYRGHRALLAQPYMAPEEDERDHRIQGGDSIDQHHASPHGHYQHPSYPHERPPHLSPSDPAAHFSLPRRSLDHSSYRAPRDRQYHPYHDSGHPSDPRDTMDYQNSRDYRGPRDQMDRRDFDSPHARPGQRSPRMAPPPVHRRSSSPTRIAYHPESHRSAHDPPNRAQSDHVMQLPPLVQRLVSDPGQGGSHLGSRRTEVPAHYPPSHDYRESPGEYRTVDQRRYDDPRSMAPPYSDFRTPMPPTGRRATESWEPSSSEFKQSYAPSPAIDIPKPRGRPQTSHFPEDDLDGPTPLHSSSLPTQSTQLMYSSGGMADGSSPFRGTFQHRGPQYELNRVNYKLIFEYASEVRDCLLKGKVGTTDRLLYNAEILSKVFMGCRVDQDPNDLPEDDAAHNPHQLRCTSCNIFKTPEWRKGPLGPRTLCNACGLIWGKMSRSKAALAAKSKALLQDADTTTKGDTKPSTAVGEPSSSSSSAPVSKKRGRETLSGEEYKAGEDPQDYEDRSRHDEDETEADGEGDRLEHGDQAT